MIRKAILLASRTTPDEGGPLTPVAGSPVIRRLVAVVEQLGIDDITVIVAPGDGPAVRDALGGKDCRATVCETDGPLLLGARRHLVGPTLIADARLLVGPDVLEALVEDRHSDVPVVLVDREVNRLYDIHAHHRAELDGRQVVRLAHGLDSGPAVIGAAMLTPATFDRTIARCLGALDGRANGRALERGWDLVPFLAEVARGGTLTAHEVRGALWHLVSGADAVRHAEWLLRAHGEELRAPTSPTLPASGSAGRTLAYIEGLLSEQRPRHNVLMNPGPVLTSPRVKSALVHHDVSHRDEEYAAVLRRVQRKLRRVSGGPEHDVLVISGSGTAALEATLSSCMAAGSKLLVISNGAFGERSAEIAALHGIATVALAYDWAEEVRPADVARLLDADPTISAVSMCHHETSVGLLNPINEVGRICRERDRLFFVDAVASLGGEKVDLRADNIDVLISSANKCLHAISGVSFVCVGARVWPRIETIPPRVYYLDLKRYREQQIPFTPAVSNCFALDAALDELLNEGVSGRVARYRATNRRIRKAVERLGLRQLTRTGNESHTLTVVEVPPYIRYAKLYEELKARGFVVYACKEHLRDRYFQIANMGELSEEMVGSFLVALEDVLRGAQRRARPPVAAVAN